ncbi:hypothetical protein LINPERHAP1_LOCUS18299 [Linum perenne]
MQPVPQEQSLEPLHQFKIAPRGESRQ